MPKENGDTLYHELAINPELYNIPDWIFALRQSGEMRDFFQDSLSFMLHNESSSESDLQSRLQEKNGLNAPLLFKLMPEILDSVMEDRNSQDIFGGFFSEYMMQLINNNAGVLKKKGVQTLLNLCGTWEESLGDDKEYQLDPHRGWGLTKEYAGFKNSLQAILSYNP